MILPVFSNNPAGPRIFDIGEEGEATGAFRIARRLLGDVVQER